MHAPSRIETTPEIRLVGSRITSTLLTNKTIELWKKFIPRTNEIANLASNAFYSVEVYPNNLFFKRFNRSLEFEKWAGMSVSSFNNIPEGMETLVIPEGKYAVFQYKGDPRDIGKTYTYILETWLQIAGYSLDDRPHFSIMTETYKNNDPDSEEELWIPIQ